MDRTVEGEVKVNGFWTSEAMKQRLPELVRQFREERVVNCSYELSMGREAYVTSERSDVKQLLEPGEQLRIPPGQFANLLTEEEVSIPSDVLGLISVKFGLKQRGLVNVSGFHVDPGFAGRLLFSVYNAGPRPIVVARGDAAFLLWCCTLESPTVDTYQGKRGREGITSEDVMHLQGEIATPQALATRIEAIERRVDRWTRIGWAIVGAVIAALVGIGFGVIEDSANRSDQEPQAPVSSTTTTP